MGFPFAVKRYPGDLDNRPVFAGSLIPLSRRDNRVVFVE
jgi:hypothetical protein